MAVADGTSENRINPSLPAHNEPERFSREGFLMFGRKKTKRPVHDVNRLCDMAHIADHQASTDVLGSYTGTGKDGEPPVQDADDL